MSVPAIIDPTPAPAIMVPALNGVGFVIGRHLVAPAVAATLDAPDTRAAIRRTALVSGAIIGACIAAGIAIGKRL